MSVAGKSVKGMPDRDNVIERLQRVSRYFKSMQKVGYDGDAEIYREHRESVKMAIDLLKEQEPVEIEMEGGGSTWWYVCEECRGSVDRGDRFCRHCGRPFKQDTGGCNGCTYKGSEDCPLGFIDSGNFYCPNGKLI